jgi:hypothetical protein
VLETNEIMDYIHSQKRKFAKTMPNIPHEYIWKEIDDRERKEFEAVVLHIREAGFKARFFERKYTYLKLDNYIYWTMGNSLNYTKCLNRASLDNYKIVDKGEYKEIELQSK